MLEEGEIDEKDIEPEERVEMKLSPTSLIDSKISQLSPEESDNSSSSKSCLTKRKHRHKSKHKKRKKMEQNKDGEEKEVDKSDTKTETISAPMSLFDLFKQSQFNKETGSFLNPVITEKENNKPKIQRKPGPLLSLPQEFQETKKKTLLSEPLESEMTVTVESIEKKVEKKRKYAEIQKERQKKDAERQQELKEKREKIPCQFFLAGRCQKGDKCPFSHQAPKKLELCKFYANGYCSKMDKCFFMHSDFPCKFFYRGQCTQGEKCRFSHQHITNPQLKEAFEKYLVEIAHEPVLKPSLLATPSSALLPTPEPVPLMNLPLNTDVDERELTKSGDVDLRTLSVPNEFDRLKQELIEKIMKNLTSIDSSKQAVMAELLVKLVNTDNSEMVKTLSLDAIKALLNSLDEKNNAIIIDDRSYEDRTMDEDERLDLHIDDLRDSEVEEIDGNCGEFEWKLFEIDLLPSILWDNPPKDNSFDQDQESDPRIKHYSNRSNCQNLANYHLKLQQQNQKLDMSNASPVYAESKQNIQSLSPLQTNTSIANTSIANSPSLAKPSARVDPRLAARNAQQSTSSPPSPPLSQSHPQPQTQTQENRTDLLSRSIKDQSLLSSLPDINLPKDLKNTLLNLNQSNVDPSSGQIAKLSFEDYKRKLHKPTNSSSANSLFSNSISNYMPKSPVEIIKSETVEPKSLLPNIPSYTVNLQPPQSLHELLRNIQS